MSAVLPSIVAEKSGSPISGSRLLRWWQVLLALWVVTMLVPFLNLWVPEGHWLHASDYLVSLLGKMLCYAMCALALDLIWG